ncbi:cytochrome P450 [Streptomyces violaceusniger]|uniref:cytochrome P450 n=1 Tax=Streptomyces violaceusniger TaxID=68280 RepID=UPI000998302B|nr:cytochrome P450 [Streptomyces hygroscopicus]AQW48426.1 cytochrome P450 [Streptomyces hygroscopicus]
MTENSPAQCPVLHGEDFAARPHEAYAALRAAGPVAWAEIAASVHALVVTSHRAAVDLVNDTGTFTRDSRTWAALSSGHIPTDSPVLALMAWRPSLLYLDGPEHKRLRQAIDDCLARIAPHELQETTRAHATALIAKITPVGKADLVADFADMVPLLVLADVFGCPPEVSKRLVVAMQKLISAGTGAAQGAADLATCLAEMIQLRKATPGQDFVSWLLSHPAQLTDEEILHQLVLVVGAGCIPTTAWIAHGLRLLLSDDDYAGGLNGGAVTVRRAMEKVLWTHSPMANFSTHYARRHTHLHGTPIPPGVPVLISHAAANTDPDLPDLGYDSRAHLAWSAGPHRCPAVSQATVVAQTAIETVLDRLWDVKLTGHHVPNRHGPFHQCPAAIPVTFRPQTAEAPSGNGTAKGGTT